MTSDEQYLIVRAGNYSISIAAQTVLRIWPTDAPDAAYSATPIDLRAVLGGGAEEKGVAVALEMADAACVLIVDAVSGMANIAEDAFMALPGVFGFARGLFDAACRDPIASVHPLRLRRQPSFEALPL
jgi:hypothetical protein